MTTKFLENKGFENMNEVIEWLNDQEGYCDCEVLANVEEKFE